MAKKISESIINRAIKYFLSNNVTFIDVCNKYNISTHTFRKYLLQSGEKYDPQRTRKGKSAWNKGLTKHNDSRVAGFAKTLSSVKVKTNRKDGYEKIYCEELKKAVKIHDYIWFKNTGYWPNSKNGEQIHHIDEDKDNCDFENLLLTTISEHTKIHKEYEQVFVTLLKNGLVKFDKNNRGVDWNSIQELIEKLKASH